MGSKQLPGYRWLDLAGLRPLGPFIGLSASLALVCTASCGKWHPWRHAGVHPRTCTFGVFPSGLSHRASLEVVSTQRAPIPRSRRGQHIPACKTSSQHLVCTASSKRWSRRIAPLRRPPAHVHLAIQSECGVRGGFLSQSL